MGEKKNFSSRIKSTAQGSETILETDLVATITPPGGESQTLIYDPTTPSGILVTDSTSYVGAVLESEYVEEITETVERGRNLIDRGVKFGFKLPDALGGVEFNLELKPKKETRTIKKAIFRKKVK